MARPSGSNAFADVTPTAMSISVSTGRAPAASVEGRVRWCARFANDNFRRKNELAKGAFASSTDTFNECICSQFAKVTNRLPDRCKRGVHIPPQLDSVKADHRQLLRDSYTFLGGIAEEADAH